MYPFHQCLHHHQTDVKSTVSHVCYYLTAFLFIKGLWHLLGQLP